tara:strand:- start:176 stop:295 length:120 start_codon:yes stop_codon:yes gene_type:complete
MARLQMAALLETMALVKTGAIYPWPTWRDHRLVLNLSRI